MDLETHDQRKRENSKSDKRVPRIPFQRNGLEWPAPRRIQAKLHRAFFVLLASCVKGIHAALEIRVSLTLLVQAFVHVLDVLVHHLIVVVRELRHADNLYVRHIPVVPLQPLGHPERR